MCVYNAHIIQSDIGRVLEEKKYVLYYFILCIISFVSVQVKTGGAATASKHVIQI